MTGQDRTGQGMTSSVFVLLYTTNEGPFSGGIIPSCRNTWTYDYTVFLLAFRIWWF